MNVGPDELRALAVLLIMTRRTRGLLVHRVGEHMRFALLGSLSSLHQRW